MKKTLLFAPAILVIFLLNNTAHTQGLKLVPNPDNGNGYNGGPIIYKNDLYFSYTGAALRSLLGKYNGDTIALIPNPVSGGVVAPLIVYNNLLYLEYYNRTAGVYQIGTYDGNAITLIPNPDASPNPSFGPFIMYNNKLCFQYNASQLAEYNGTAWKLFSAPASGSFTYQGGLTVYHNKLFMGYQTVSNERQMMQFNDTAMTLIDNPDGATAFNPLGGGYQGLPIIYNDGLYIKYVAITGVTHLAKYNDTALTLIANPDASPYGYGFGSEGSPLVYNNKLYIQYLNASHITQLAAYDGTAMSLIANPDGGKGYQGAPIVYDSSLYIQYQDVNSVYRLAKYNGTALSLIANPDKGGYANYTTTGAEITPPILYGKFINHNVNLNYYLYNLYIQYEDSTGINRLGQYNDTALTLITNPDTTKLHNDAGGTGYKGSAFIYNNALYVQYYSAANIFQLAYLNLNDSTTLPVTFINFTAQPKGDDNLLQWQTVTEINSNYFNIQRSITGSNFATIGKVNAAGASTAKINYAYTDHFTAGDLSPVVYYRLQEVDKDGKIAYSNIAVVRKNIINGGFVIAPNPVRDVINLQAGSNIGDAVVILQDMNGKVLYSAKQQNITAGEKIQVSTSALAKGMYIVTIKTNNTSYWHKVLKAE